MDICDIYKNFSSIRYIYLSIIFFKKKPIISTQKKEPINNDRKRQIKKNQLVITNERGVVLVSKAFVVITQLQTI